MLIQPISLMADAAACEFMQRSDRERARALIPHIIALETRVIHLFCAYALRAFLVSTVAAAGSADTVDFFLSRHRACRSMQQNKLKKQMMVMRVAVVPLTIEMGHGCAANLFFHASAPLFR